MKKLAFIILGIFILNPSFGQDPNILIGLNSPSYGVRIKANWPNTTTGWARSFSISNQDNTQTFIGFGATGSATNGVASFDYGYIGRDYNQTFMSFLANGNVGIGTTTPTQKLDVSGNIRMNSFTTVSGSSSMYNTDQITRLTFNVNTATNALVYYYNQSTTTFQTLSLGSSNPAYCINILPSGNVGIGTANPGNYKLAVEGIIGAREVKVTTSAWADFVFHPTYKLRTLFEVEQFIKINKHLPEIPTEAEVKENGISIGEMNAKLLQKIEELTLYMIEQQKQINEMKEQNAILTNEVEKLKSKP